MLNELFITHLSLTIQSKKNIHNLLFPSALFRSGLGLFLRKSVCFQTMDYPCKACEDYMKCPYPFYYEDKGDEAIEIDKYYVPYIRPIVIRFPKMLARKGQSYEMELDLIFFGEAYQDCPIIIKSLMQLGESGVGRERMTFTLQQLLLKHPQKEPFAVSSLNELLQANDYLFNLETLGLPTEYELSQDHNRVENTHLLQSDSQSTLTFKFLTPTTIKNNKEKVELPSFRQLFDAMFSKITSVLYFHHHKSPHLEYYNQLKTLADSVVVETHYIERSANQRYSVRKDQCMSFDGFIGDITYSGDITPFIPLFKIGEYLHLGKQAMFGYGEYKVGY